jgi:hypothetical protein
MDTEGFGEESLRQVAQGMQSTEYSENFLQWAKVSGYVW